MEEQKHGVFDASTVAKALYVLFGAFFMTLPILPPQLSLFGDAAGYNATRFAATVAAVVAAGVVLAAWALLGRRGAFRLPRWVGLTGSAGYVVLCIACMLVPGGVLAIDVTLGLLCGVTLLIPAIGWGLLFALLPFREALALTAGALGLGGMFNFLFVVGLFDARPLTCIVAMCCGVAIPFAACLRGDVALGKEQREEGVQSSKAPAASGVPDAAGDSGALRSATAKPFATSRSTSNASLEASSQHTDEEAPLGYSLSTMLDLCVGLFLLVFASSARAEAYDSGALPGSFEYAESFAFVGGALCVAVLLAVRRRLEISAVVNLYIPVAAAVFFFLAQFAVESPTFGAAFWLSHVLMAFIVLLALACLAAVSGAREVSPWALYAGLYAGTAVCSLLGTRLYVLVGPEEIGPALLPVASAYFVYVVLAALVRSRRLIEKMANREGAEGGEASASETCAKLAERYALSAREAEVLGYLAAGHGSPYIAEKLFISENTVRTHMRNMYRKMGVSSKEELIGLIESECENV